MSEFFKKKRPDWSKCKSLTTDGAAAMQGSQKGMVKRIKQLSPECVRIHRILYREALVMKKLKLNAVAVGGQENELNDVLLEVVDIVNSIWKSAKQQRLFSKLCNETSSTSKKLILYSEVRWLSRGKVLSRVFELREQLETYYTEQGNQKAAKFRDMLWPAKLAYLASIFDRLDEVNLSLQGKGSDIFRAISKINALKLKIPLWKNNVLSNNFNDFSLLSHDLRECGWEFDDVSLENDISTLIVAHLNLLSENLAGYFPKDDDKHLEKTRRSCNDLLMNQQRMRNCWNSEKI